MAIYPSLIKPRTNGEIFGNLGKTASITVVVPPAEWLISLELGQNITTFVQQARTDEAALGNALGAMTNKNRELSQYRNFLYWYSSDMIHELNFNIRRRLSPFSNPFRDQDRSYYHIPVKQESLPDMHSRNDLVKWAERLIDGEKSRIAAGKPALVATTWEMLETILNTFKQKEAEHNVLMIAFRNAEKQVANRRDEGSGYYNDLVDELKFKLKDLSDEMFRMTAEPWGLMFKSVGWDDNVYGEVIARISCDTLPVNNVLVSFDDLGLEFKTDIYGNFRTFQVKAGIHHITISCEGYETVVIEQFKVELHVENEIRQELVMTPWQPEPL